MFRNKLLHWQTGWVVRLKLAQQSTTSLTEVERRSIEISTNRVQPLSWHSKFIKAGKFWSRSSKSFCFVARQPVYYLLSHHKRSLLFKIFRCLLSFIQKFNIGTCPPSSTPISSLAARIDRRSCLPETASSKYLSLICAWIQNIWRDIQSSWFELAFESGFLVTENKTRCRFKLLN